MSDPIVVEITDKVNTGISKKIKDIAASARDAQSKVDTLQSAINSLNGNTLSELTKQFKSVTSSLREELDMLKAATKAAGDNSLATAKLATEQQRLATEVAKTGTQTAKTSVETAKLTAAQNNSALAAQKLATEQNKTAKALADAEAAAARTAAAKQRLSDTQNKTAESSLNLANAFKLLIASVAVSEYIKMSDAVTNLQSRLKLVTSGTQELNSVQEQLYKTAQDSRTNYIELGNLYGQIARSAKDAGVSTQGLLGITKTISQAMTIGGGSAESMKAALVQLSQGFASGTLRGEELNSVMEQTPRLAQAIAEGLGVSIGKLREMGKEGKLTSEAVMGALEKSAAGVEAEFAKMTPTIGQAFTNLSNAMTKTVGEFNDATGASNLLATGISGISKAVEWLGGLIKEYQSVFSIIAGGLGGTIAAAAFLSVAAGIKAVSVGILALNAALLANPATLALLGIGAAVGAGVAVASAWNKTETGITRTTEALIKQRDIIEKNLASGRLDDDQKKANLETLANVNKSISENNVKLDEMNGLYAQSSLRSQEIQAQNAVESASIKKKTEAQDSFKKMMEGLSGVTDEYRRKEAEFNKIKDSLSDKDRAAGVAALKAEYDKMTGATKAASSTMKDKRAEDLFQIKNTIELNKLNGELAKKADSLVNDYKKQRIGAAELSKQLKSLVEVQEAYNLAMATAKVRQSQVNKDYKDSADALADIEKADQDRVKSLTQGNKELEDEIQQLGLGKRGLVQYAYAKNQAAIEDLKFKRNIDDTNPVLQEQLALLEKRGELILNKGIAEEIQVQKQAYSDFFADIERGLTDSLYNAFQNGGSFGKTFWEGIKNMFKTTVLKFAIQGVFGGITGAIGNALGIGGGSGNIASSIGTSLIGRGATSIGLGGFGSGFMSGFGETLAGSSFVGPSATLAGGATGFGATLGTIAPYALAAVALISLIKSLDDSGTYHTGGAARYSEATGLTSGNSGADYNFGFGQVETGKETISAMEILSKNLVQIFDGIAKTFGKTAGYEVATAFADDTSKDGAWGAFKITLQGKDVLNWNDFRESKWAPKEFGDGEEGYKQYLSAIAKDTRQVLLDMDLPSWADKILTDLGDSASMESLTAAVQQIAVIKAAYDELTKSIINFANITDNSFSELLKEFGGIENLSSKVSSYYDTYYSEAEKFQKLQFDVSEAFKKMGVSMPTSRDEFRKLAESQDLNTEAGRKMYAQLMEISGAFAAITDNSEQAARALDISNRKFDLQNQLLELQGKSREALDARRNKINTELMALDPELAKLQYEIWLLEDAASNAAAETERLRKAEEERKAALSTAYNVLQTAIAAEKALINEQITATSTTVNSLQQIFDVIHQSVIALRGDVSSTKAMQLMQANALIDTAYTSGTITDNTKFSEAVTAARASLTTSNYATQSDYDNAVLTLIAKLSSLEGSTSGQLTDAQKQLNVLNEQNKQLDATLDYWKKQIDIANGTYIATISVAEAVAGLNSVITQALAIKPVGTQTPTTGGTVNPNGPSWGGGSGAAATPSPTAPAKYKQVTSLGTSIVYVDITDPAVIAKLDQLAPLYHSFDGTGNLTGLLTAFKDAGGSMYDLSALSGLFVSDWVKAGEAVGIPAFATGGYHRGGAFIGNEYGAELMYSPGALNIHNAADTAIMTDNGSMGLNQLAVLLMQVIAGNSKNAELLDKILESNEGSEEDIEAMKNTLISITDSRGSDAVRVVQ